MTQFKPGDVVEWISDYNGGRGSLAVVTQHTTGFGVNVYWICMAPQLRNLCNQHGRKWETDGWSSSVFRKIGEIELREEVEK